MDPALRSAIDRLGGVVKFSRAIGRPHSTVLSWPRVPAEKLIEIEEKTGIAREELRPDLYRSPTEVVDASPRIARPPPRDRDGTPEHWPEPINDTEPKGNAA